MFEQLLKMASSQLTDQLSNRTDIPADQVSGIASTAGESIFNAISSQVTSGNLGGIKEMLSGSETAANSPAVSSMTQNVVSQLVAKNGLSEGVASNIANVAIPYVMNMFNSNVAAQQSAGGIDVPGMISSALSNGAASGVVSNLLGGVLGGNKDEANQGNSAQNMIGNLLGKFIK
jgi:hypothetical protein